MTHDVVPPTRPADLTTIPAEPAIAETVPRRTGPGRSPVPDALPIAPVPLPRDPARSLPPDGAPPSGSHPWDSFENAGPDCFWELPRN